MRYNGTSGGEASWMTVGGIVSGGMHAGLLALVIWGLPVFRSSDDTVAEPPSIEVALIGDVNPPPAPVLNLKQPSHTETKPEVIEPPNPELSVAPPEPVAVKPEPVKPEAVPLPPRPKPAEPPPPAAVAEPDPAPQPAPQEKPDTPVTPEPPKPSRLAEVRPKTKPTPPKEPPKPASDFDQLMKDVEKMKPAQSAAASDRSASPDRKPAQTQASAGAPNHNSAKPLSMSEKAYIKAQIARNWNLDAGIKDIERIIVRLHVAIEQDGTVRSVEAAEPAKMNDPGYRAVALSAIRAVRLSSPLDYPKAKYETFKLFELEVRPGDALNRR